MGKIGKSEQWLTEDGLLLLRAWARDDLLDEQIAKKMGICTSTLYNWKKKYPEIDEALKEGKEPVDIGVENDLLKRARGYKYDEVTRELRVDMETGKSKLVATKVITKEMPGDVAAQIYWLKNRKPDKWKERREDDTAQKDVLAKLDEVMKGIDRSMNE